MKFWIQIENKSIIILTISILLYNIFKDNQTIVAVTSVLAIIGILANLSKIYKDSKESKEKFIRWIVSFIIAFCIYGLIYWFKKG